MGYTFCRLAFPTLRYGWDRNAGYPTKLHREGILSHGLTPYHRRSFGGLGEAQLPFAED